jgi:hypothetical protein
MFVLALKRVVLLPMHNNIVAGILPCSAAGTGCYEDHWPDIAPATRVVIALSKLTMLGSSLPSVAALVHAGGHCMSTLGVGW